MRDYNLIVAVDFDGTIVKHGYPDIGEEIPGAILILKKMQQMGIQLILWTCRHHDDLVAAVKWCEEKGLVFDAVNSNIADPAQFQSPKVFANVYIDDRCGGAFGEFTKEKWVNIGVHCIKMQLDKR